MFCINCGNKIDEGDKFCGFCGAVVESDVADTSSSLNSSNSYDSYSSSSSSESLKSPSSSSSSQSHNSFKFDPLHNRKQLIIMITSIILAIALVITGTVLYYVKKNPTSIANLTSTKAYAKIPKAKAGDNVDNVAKPWKITVSARKLSTNLAPKNRGNSFDMRMLSRVLKCQLKQL